MSTTGAMENLSINGTHHQQQQQTPSPSPSPSVPSVPASSVPLTPAQQAQREEDAHMEAKELTLTQEQKEKRDIMRAQVIQEIQSTELSYVQSLDALTSCFVAPLKKQLQVNKHFQDISQVFGEYLCSNLETLANFHHSFIDSLVLVKPVAPGSGSVTPAPADASSSTPVAAEAAAPVAPSASATSSGDSPSIPSIFLKFSSFFRLYIPYLNGYENALNTFNSLRTHKRFQEWLNGEVKTALNAHASKNGSSTLDLLSYMIQPVQRVPRYVLLLRELKRQTSPSHPEFHALNDALIKVQHVASVINEGQRAVENANKLMLLQNKIIGDLPESLVQPHRRLIREGIVQATYTHGMFSTIRTRKSIFFLFSDALLWTSEQWKFKGLLDLTPAKLTPKSSTSFTIDTANKMIQATFDTDEETKAWFEEIDATIAALQNEREKLRQRARVQKARALGNTANKDAVHQLVTQSLQGLQAQGGSSGMLLQVPGGGGSNNDSSDLSGGSSTPGGGHHGSSVSTGGSMHHGIAPSSDTPESIGTGGRSVAAVNAGSGTIGKTLGQRSGRKFEDALEAGEAKLRKEQEHLAAFSREKLQADTFAPPPSANGETDTNPDYTGGEFASSSASPPASGHTAAPAAAAPVIGGDKKYVARFVARRGRGTMNGGCLCTTILVHKDCPQHGEAAMEEAGRLLETNQ